MDFYELSIAALLSGSAQLVVSMLLMGLLWPLASKVHKSLESSPIYRPNNDWRMSIYLPFVSPFVNGFMTALAYRLLGTSGSLPLGFFSVALPWNVGIEFGVALWFVGAFHGIFIDHCCYRQSLNVTLWFQFMTFVQAIVSGAAIGYWLM
mmetsp:Transcript_38812/g.97791  ORF Transcript_38812/g.97791 Transcript_38812/m.97791 type:complete len:150 (+) Transcript_38812:116-565(+)